MRENQFEEEWGVELQERVMDLHRYLDVNYFIGGLKRWLRQTDKLQYNEAKESETSKIKKNFPFIWCCRKSGQNGFWHFKFAVKLRNLKN